MIYLNKWKYRPKDSLALETAIEIKGGEIAMEIKELKMLLAGFSIVGLLAGGALLLPGCASG